MWKMILIAVLMLTAPAVVSADDARQQAIGSFALPAGAWLLDIEFPTVPGAPPPPPPFVETLTLHALGTVSESNTLLNENSYNPALGQGCGFTGPGGALELNCNGSDGTGSWRRTGRNTVSFVVLKLVFDGATNAHVGYLRLTTNRAVVRGNTLTQAPEDSLTEILIGTDIDTAIPIPLGGAAASGGRIR